MPHKKRKPRPVAGGAAAKASGIAASFTVTGSTNSAAQATAQAKPVRVEATPPDLEAVMEIDRGYFARHPHRHYYCRRMYEAERAQQARAGGHLPRRPGVLDVVV